MMGEEEVEEENDKGDDKKQWLNRKQWREMKNKEVL